MHSKIVKFQAAFYFIFSFLMRNEYIFYKKASFSEKVAVMLAAGSLHIASSNFLASTQHCWQ